MNIDPSPPPGRYETIVAMLQTIIKKIDALEQDVDDIDRTLRPYGDGTKPPRRRR